MKKLLTLVLTTVLSVNTAFAEQVQETSGLVVAGGKPITLLGKQVYKGNPAPDFSVVDEGFKRVSLADFKGKTVLISAVPSLDTGVCSIQTKRFNEEVANLPENVVVLTISADLPFAQKRFCSTEGVDALKVLSDSVWHDFGEKYGLVIKDMGLLSRSIFVINGQGNIVYKELVPDISKEPNYDQALAAAKESAELDKAI
ncbi:thiol peroxidase [Thalassotalea ponticola]|nr:thiol peroxidase [Thalassotalea ponticola]MDN3653218.1 thiol peroxidase [Thalassotalea ponticola]